MLKIARRTPPGGEPRIIPSPIKSRMSLFTARRAGSTFELLERVFSSANHQTKLHLVNQASEPQDQSPVEEMSPIEHPLQRFCAGPCALVGADARKGVKHVAHGAYANR